MIKNIFGLCFIAFITLISPYLFTGCGESDQNSIEGTEYSIETVNKLIDSALEQHTPDDIKVNQYFFYEDNFQVELADPKIRATFESHILDLEETENQYNLLVLNTEVTYDQFGNTEKNISEQNVSISKQSYALSEANVFKNYFEKNILKSNYTLNNNAYIKVFNLRSENIRLPYPTKVQKKMGCSLKSPCKFEGLRIRFVIHEYSNKIKPTKYAIDRIYMKGGLYLASTYSSCISRFYETSNRDYYIKQCSVLRDYGFKNL